MKIHFTRRAVEDLHAIADYITAHSESGAQNVELALLKSIEELSEFPMLGVDEKELGVRKLLVPKYPYAIYYRVESDNVWIVHVRHGSRRLPEGGDL